MMCNKKTMYDKLVIKINVIDINRFVLKTQYNANKSDLENKIFDASKKIPDASRVAKKQIIILRPLRFKVKHLVLLIQLLLLLLILVKTRYPTLVIQSKKKENYDAKKLEIEFKYLTTSDYNKFKNEIIDNKIKEKNLVKKSDISLFIGNSDLDKRIATLATKAELKVEQDKIVKLQVFSNFELFSC